MRDELQSQIVAGIVSVINTLLVCGTLVILGYWAYLTLAAYAGKSTFASVAVSLAADLKIDRWIAYAFGVGGAAYGWGQKKLRQRSIERLTKRPNDLEKRIDEGRTSSGLTPRGTTQPRDRR